MNNCFNLFKLCLLASLVPCAWANTPTSAILDIKPESTLTAPILATPTTAPPITKSDDNALYLKNFDELIAYPKVLERLLDKAVADGDMTLVGQILPVYQQAYVQNLVSDGILLNYATALYARSQGKMGQAIAILSQLSDQNPEHKPIKLQLAMTELADKRHKSAKQSLQAVQADPNLPDGLRQQLANYDKQVKDDYFDVNVGFRYLDDDNVNNAPKVSTYGNWQLPTPQSAHGMGYSVGGSGKVAVADHISATYGLMGFGKYYWDNHDYNDHTTKATIGLLYETARQSVAGSLVASDRRFGGERYSQSLGVDLRHSIAISPKLQANHNLQVSKVTHATRTHLDGTDIGVSGTWVRGLGLPYRYVYGGYDLAYDNAQDNSDKSMQAGVRLGGSRQFGNLVADGSLGVYRRQYKGEDFFNIKRTDKIYTLDIGLSKSNWHYKGFVPKLVLAYEKTDSNHFMYDNDKKEWYITVQKVF